MLNFHDFVSSTYRMPWEKPTCQSLSAPNFGLLSESDLHWRSWFGRFGGSTIRGKTCRGKTRYKKNHCIQHVSMKLWTFNDFLNFFDSFIEKKKANKNDSWLQQGRRTMQMDGQIEVKYCKRKRQTTEGIRKSQLQIAFRFFQNLQYEFWEPQKKDLCKAFVNLKAMDLGWSEGSCPLQPLACSNPPIFNYFQATFPHGSCSNPCSGLPFDGKRCAFRKSATCPNFATRQPGWLMLGDLLGIHTRYSIAWAGTISYE